MMKMIFILASQALAGAPETPVPPPEDVSAEDAPAEEPDVDEVVVVTGDGTPTRLADAVVATEVIDRVQIERSGAVSLDQLLEMVPGLQLVEGVRGVGISLRGHAPEHTLVLVDGRRTLGRIGGSLDLRRFTVDEIERIEIVRGAVSSLYGADALGGVINLVTRDASEAWFAETRLTAGGHAVPGLRDDRAVVAPAEGALAGLDQLGLDLAGGFRQGRTRGRAGLSAHGLDGWDRSPDAAGTSGDATRTLAPSASLAFRPGEHDIRFLFDGLFAEGRGTDGAATGAVIERLYRTETWDGGVQARLALPRGVVLDSQLDVSTYRDQLRTDQRGSDALDGYDSTREVLGRLRSQAAGFVDAGQRHQLLGGAELLLEEVRADRLSEERVGRTRGGLWIQHQGRLVDAIGWVIQPGVRLDIDSLFGVFPAPRLSTRLVPHDRVSIRVSGGAGYRAPDFRQLFLAFANPAVGYTVAGNPGLRPERSWGVQGDVDVTAHDLLQVGLAGWHDAVRDLIGTDLVSQETGTDAYGYVNVGRARVQGLTGTVRIAPAEAVGGTLAYTFTDADDLDAVRPLPGRAEHQLQAQVSGRERRTGISGQLTATVLGPRPFYGGDAGLATLTPWTPLVDARLAWRPNRAFELFAGVDNLIDAGDPDLDAARPRRVYGGLLARLSPRNGG